MESMFIREPVLCENMEQKLMDNFGEPDDSKHMLPLLITPWTGSVNNILKQDWWFTLVIKHSKSTTFPIKYWNII